MTAAGTSRTGLWVLTATILASSMAFIDGTALNVAMPAIQNALNASGEQLLWVVNAYLVMLLCAALSWVGAALAGVFVERKGLLKD